MSIEIGAAESFPRTKSPSETAEIVESELTRRIEIIHSKLSLIPKGTVHRVLRQEDAGLEPKTKKYHRIVHELCLVTDDIELLFKRVPQNYYLELQISPSAYGGIRDIGFPFARSERVGNTLNYYVDCGIFLTHEKGRTAAFIRANMPRDSRVLPYLYLGQTGEGSDGKFLNLKDIQNAKVKKIPNETRLVPLR